MHKDTETFLRSTARRLLDDQQESVSIVAHDREISINQAAKIVHAMRLLNEATELIYDVLKVETEKKVEAPKEGTWPS